MLENQFFKLKQSACIFIETVGWFFMATAGPYFSSNQNTTTAIDYPG